MKKLFLLFAVAVMALTAKAEDSIASVLVEKPTAIVHQYADENYKLYPTQNMYIFILLDTRNGRLELVQWNTKSSSRTRATLSWQRRIGYAEEEKPGRFELYPTTNMYNFIMVDKVDGKHGKSNGLSSRMIEWYYKSIKLMPCPHNSIDCPCTKEGCPRHGKCCECVAHHKKAGTKLPACLRGIDWQK